jgi:post-segregation antitoxin (ccd killing protein)
MNKKEKFSHVSLLMSVDQKKDLDAYCKELDLNTSQLARRLILAELKNKTWAKIEHATINGTKI